MSAEAGHWARGLSIPVGRWVVVGMDDCEDARPEAGHVISSSQQRQA